jgi:hypothetical protein
MGAQMTSFTQGSIAAFESKLVRDLAGANDPGDPRQPRCGIDSLY